MHAAADLVAGTFHHHHCAVIEIPHGLAGPLTWLGQSHIEKITGNECRLQRYRHIIDIDRGHREHFRDLHQISIICDDASYEKLRHRHHSRLTRSRGIGLIMRREHFNVKPFTGLQSSKDIQASPPSQSPLLIG